jgi:2-(3-amino-3-carboxypropyl)histidine synthase
MPGDMIMNRKFDYGSLLEKLKKADARRVLIQIPEGLKTVASEIAGYLDSRGFETMVSVEPCFGACDIRDKDAEAFGCDVLVHFGHSDLGLKTAVPVIYEEYKIDYDPSEMLEKNAETLSDFQSVGVFSTIQYTASLEKAKSLLEKQGKEVIIGKSPRLKPGQILGCDFTAAEEVEKKADCLLYIGSGRFHPMGLVEKTTKPVFFLDVENENIADLSPERDKMEIKRRLRIEKAKDAKNFAVFISTKPGQISVQEAEAVKMELTGKGRKTTIITADMLTPDKIRGMGFEVLVNTACPRIYEDQKLFGLIILNPQDIDSL